MFLDDAKILSVQEAMKDIYAISDLVNTYRNMGKIKSVFDEAVNKNGYVEDEFGWDKCSICKRDEQRTNALELLMDKYHYRWYIAEQSVEKQIKALVDFESYILSHIGQKVVYKINL